MRKYVVFLIILIVSLMLFYESRHFYKIGDRTLTVWKTNNGCFVIPYSYYGILPPQKNYLRLSNIGTVHIFIVPNDSLYTKVSHPLKHCLFSFPFACRPPYSLTFNT